MARTLFGRNALDFHRLFGYCFSVFEKEYASRSDFCTFSVLQKCDLARVFGYCQSVACDEVFFFTYADRKRRAETSRVYCVVSRFDCEESRRALEHFANFFYCERHIRRVFECDKVRYYFAIGGREEGYASCKQVFFELVAIGDYAVVHDCDLSVKRYMRVRVLRVGRSVRRPTRVTNGNARCQVREYAFQLLDAPCRLV